MYGLDQPYLCVSNRLIFGSVGVWIETVLGLLRWLVMCKPHALLLDSINTRRWFFVNN
jgi:hypothetical protein